MRECFAKQVGAAAQRLDAAGPFVLGEHFSGPDLLLTTCLVSAIGREIELPGMLHAYLKRTTARDGYRQALEVNRPKHAGPDRDAAPAAGSPRQPAYSR